MVVADTEMIPHRELEPTAEADHQHVSHGPSASGDDTHQPFHSLGRQSSIYSLTLDEFQHALCETGKNFGSMNMDEFLVSIWNAEENNAQAVPAGNESGLNATAAENSQSFENGGIGGSCGEPADGKRGIVAEQPSLQRQGSLTLPTPLCRKTVDEVWSEIHRGQTGNNHNGNGSSRGYGHSNKADDTVRQRTFGEMTLEDFLVKAGVVREKPNNPNLNPNLNPNQVPIIPPATQQQPQQQHFGVFPSQTMPATGGGYAQVLPAQPGVGYSGYGQVGPLSPVSSDGLGHGQVDNMGGGPYGVDMGVSRGKKRMGSGDGPVEIVVERRQRRMIKNRESAARSRARKQAYTVELEAELNLLKEENTELKHALVELEKKRKQQKLEETKMNNLSQLESESKASKAKERLGKLMRKSSCPL